MFLRLPLSFCFVLCCASSTEEGERWKRDDSIEELFLRNNITSADMTSLDHIHEPAVLSNLADRWREKTKKP
jgi:myosin heavy subunit